MVAPAAMLDALWKQVRQHPHDQGAHVALVDALLERGDPAGPLMLEALHAGEGDVAPALLELLAPALGELASRVIQRWGVPREVCLASYPAPPGHQDEAGFGSEALWAGITRLHLVSGLGVTPLPRPLLRRIIENAHQLDKVTGVPFTDFVTLCEADRALRHLALVTDPDPNIERGLATPRLRVRSLSLPGDTVDTGQSALWWLLHHGRELLEHVEELALFGADADCVPLVLEARGPALRHIAGSTWSATLTDDGRHFVVAEELPDGSRTQRVPLVPISPPPRRRPVETLPPRDCPFASPEYDDLIAHLAHERSECWVDAWANGAWTVTVLGAGLFEPGVGLFGYEPEFVPDALDLLPGDFTLRYRRVELLEPPDDFCLVEHGPVHDRIERRFASDERRTLLTITAFGTDTPALQLVAFAGNAAYERALPGDGTPLRLGPELTARFPLQRLVELARARGFTAHGSRERIARRHEERRARALQPPPCVEEEDLPF